MLSMTYPRSHQVDPDNPGFYHLSSTCVRGAHLCGRDPQSGRDYSSRRRWLENRILELAEYFAIDVYAYAVMSNHYHIVVRTDPARLNGIDDAEVARRWVLSMKHPGTHLTEEELNQRTAALLADSVKLKRCRERLASVSWYMAKVNEPLARKCNIEDGTKGHFWQKRFHSGALLDEKAIMTCMIYVDLNPVRAGIAKSLESSAHTGIRQRVRGAKWRRASMGQPLRPLSKGSGQNGDPDIPITLREYIELVRWIGENVVYPDKASLPSSDATLKSLGIEPASCIDDIMAHGYKFRAYGSASCLRQFAARCKQRWVQTSRSEPNPGVLPRPAQAFQR